MEKTLREIAQDLGLPKQRVYRYVVQYHISEVDHNAAIKRYDEAAQKAIKEGLRAKEPRQRSASDAHPDTDHDTAMMQAMIQTLRDQIDMLNKHTDMLTEQLRAKDDQIRQLQQALDQEQQLTALSQRRWWQKLLPVKSK